MIPKTKTCSWTRNKACSQNRLILGEVGSNLQHAAGHDERVERSLRTSSTTKECRYHRTAKHQTSHAYRASCSVKLPTTPALCAAIMTVGPGRILQRRVSDVCVIKRNSERSAVSTPPSPPFFTGNVSSHAIGMLLGNADGRIRDAASASKIGLPKFLGAANVGARAHLAPRNIESGSSPGEGGLDIGRHAFKAANVPAQHDPTVVRHQWCAAAPRYKHVVRMRPVHDAPELVLRLERRGPRLRN